MPSNGTLYVGIARPPCFNFATQNVNTVHEVVVVSHPSPPG